MFTYFKNVEKEFRKIRWIKSKEMFADFRFIFVMSIFFILFFGLMDYGINLLF
jgi:preprotein translocase SecE subunit